jgi:hypothetical protein
LEIDMEKEKEKEHRFDCGDIVCIASDQIQFGDDAKPWRVSYGHYPRESNPASDVEPAIRLIGFVGNKAFKPDELVLIAKAPKGWKLGNEDAFPAPDNCDSNGMSKREHFAALAMQGILAGMNGWPDRSCFDTIAERATGVADALLARLDG